MGVGRSGEPREGRGRGENPGEGLFDAIVVGAGFAGLYQLHRLRGAGLRVIVLEQGEGVGGTWYWNRYPGARCDVESLEYSYQFSEELQQEWEWTERYATQPEILSYLEHVADRFDLRRDIRFGSRVLSARFDEENVRWEVGTDGGDVFLTRFLIMATGCLSSPNTPSFEGLERFEGELLHTGRWPHAPVDFSGKRVGVIGTGSSAIQSIPLIAKEALHVHVFQRTPNYSVPAHNQPLDPAYVEEVKSGYADFRARNLLMPAAFGADIPRDDVSALDVAPEERERVYEERWARGGLPFLGGFNDLLLTEEANESAAEFVRGKIREIVNDPVVAEKLCPEQRIGCKRLCVDTDYYETFNRPNVTLVDVKETPIDEITPEGVRCGSTLYEVDSLVLATGFDAMTGCLLKMDIRGRGGRTLAEKWKEGPRTYLGLATAGFPNLFTITGPGSPSVLTNMVVSIEHHVDFITDCIRWLDENDRATIEPEGPAEDTWVGIVNTIAEATLYPGCNSWYLGANIPGKSRVFMPFIGFPIYAERVEQVVAAGYEGFRTTARISG